MVAPDLPDRKAAVEELEVDVRRDRLAGGVRDADLVVPALSDQRVV
jgi:hypothetical protein